MLQVVNKHRHRMSQGRNLYIGRPSQLGNPFRIGLDGTRDEVIEKYRHWLWKRMHESESIRKTVRELDKFDYLVCYCAPLPCHGDVLIRAHNWLIEQERTNNG